MPQIFWPGSGRPHPAKSFKKSFKISPDFFHNVSGLVYNSIIKKGKTMEMIYLVINDKGYLEMMYDNEQSAKDYITLNGNENYTIDSEEMC